MAQTSDPSFNTMPRPELNPLLNPLLAENMTRWAEVYFNNPPERREQAVLDLLRDLEAQRALREAATIAPSTMFHDAPPARVSAAPVPSPHSGQAPELVRCERCGRDNPIPHKFCGMCGETLHPERVVQSPAGPMHVDGEDSKEPEEGRIETESESDLGSYQERYVLPASNWNGLSLLQSGKPMEYDGYDDADDAYETSRSHPYRIFLGGLLTIVLLALGYTAWRASQNTQTADEPSSPPPIAAKDSTSPAAQPAPSTPTKETTPAPATEKLAPPAAMASSATPTHANRDEANADSRPASAKPDEEAPSQPSTAGGDEELAQAEAYLNGSDGRGRDSVAAAQLLWKSMAKHNGHATLLLADLYLRGDGVAKSCDQARVLLYAAARKGLSGSGERLRHMQAFGCQ